MVLDFAKEAIENCIRNEKEQYIKRINECLNPHQWTDGMLDSFILGYKLGFADGKEK